jgi:hypothetical protein
MGHNNKEEAKGVVPLAMGCDVGIALAMDENKEGKR